MTLPLHRAGNTSFILYHYLDRYAGLSGSGGFRGGFRGGLRGMRGGRGGYPRGGYSAAGHNEDLYKDYPGPDQQAGTGGGYPAGYDAGYAGPGAGGCPGGVYGAGAYEVEPSHQIMVCNVSRPVRAVNSP